MVATKHWSKGDQISSLIGNYDVVFFRNALLF